MEHKEDAKDGNDEDVKDEEVKVENFVESKGGAMEKEGPAKKRQKIMVDEENDCDEGGEEEAKESDPLVFPANIQLTGTVMQQRTKFCKAASSFYTSNGYPPKEAYSLACRDWMVSPQRTALISNMPLAEQVRRRFVKKPEDVE